MQFQAQHVLRLIVFACLLAIGQLVFGTSAVKASTGINQQLNYQARLLNAQGATVADGNYNIQFKIYKNGDGTLAGDTGGSGGTLLWTENWQNSNSQGVTVKNGYLSVQLGSICALSGGSCQGNTNTGVDFNQSVLWLSINVGGTSVGASPTYDGEMLPMRQLAAAPYALNSNMLGGLTSSQFIQFAPNTVQADSSTNNSIFLNKTGSSGNIIDLQKAGTDVLVLTNSGNLGVGTNTPQNTLSVSPTQYNTGTASQSGTTITGSGTTWTSSMVGDQMTFANGTVAFITGFTSTTSLTASVSQTVTSQAYTLSYVGLQVSNTGNVGIGQATPTRLLDIAQNSAQIAAPMELLEQNGTGDVTIELKSANTGTSFYVGQDTSNSGAFTINSSTAATPSGVTFVQNASNQNDGAVNNIAQAFSSNITSGNLIIASFGWSHNGSETFTCSDSLGNTFSSTSMYQTNGAQTELGVCWAVANSSGSDTITATFPGTRNFRRMVVSEYHNAASTPLDVSAVSTGTAATSSGTDNATTGSATTTQTNDLVYAALDDTGNAGTAVLTAGTNYTSRGVVTTADTDRFMTEDKIQATAASTSATWTDTISGNQYVGVMVAFKAAPATITDTFNNPLFTLSQTGGAKFQNSTNSTAELAIQNAAGTQLLGVDSTNSRVIIGNGATGTTTPAVLVLNSGTSATSDPTGVEGAMYYNSGLKTFRCYFNAAWHPCAGGAVYAQTGFAGGDSVNNTTTATALTESYTILANDCSSGRHYRLTANGIYGTTTGTNNLTLTLKFGSTVMLATPTTTMPASIAVNSEVGWNINADFQCYSGNPGSSGPVGASGNWTYATNTSGSTTALVIMPNANANINGYLTINTTTTQAITLTAQWSVANTANNLTLRQFTIEAIGP